MLYKKILTLAFAFILFTSSLALPRNAHAVHGIAHHLTGQIVGGSILLAAGVIDWTAIIGLNLKRGHVSNDPMGGALCFWASCCCGLLGCAAGGGGIYLLAKNVDSVYEFPEISLEDSAKYDLTQKEFESYSAERKFVNSIGESVVQYSKSKSNESVGVTQVPSMGGNQAQKCVANEEEVKIAKSFWNKVQPETLEALKKIVLKSFEKTK